MIPIYCIVCKKNIGKSRFEYHLSRHHAFDELPTDQYLQIVRKFKGIEQ